MKQHKSGKEQHVKEKRAKKVKRVPVEHVALYAFCSCGGEMVWVTEGPAELWNEGNPHQCEECGKVETYDRLYPDVETVVKFKGKKLRYNQGNVKEHFTDGMEDDFGSE